VGLLLIVLAGIALIGAWIWMWSIALEESFFWWFLVAFCGIFAQWMFILAFFDKAWKPLALEVLGFILLVIGAWLDPELASEMVWEPLVYFPEP